MAKCHLGGLLVFGFSKVSGITQVEGLPHLHVLSSIATIDNLGLHQCLNRSCFLLLSSTIFMQYSRDGLSIPTGGRILAPPISLILLLSNINPCRSLHTADEVHASSAQKHPPSLLLLEKGP